MGSACALPILFGAGEESRTLDLYLGKVSLYQLSYSRKTFLLPASNFWVKNPRRFQTFITWSGRRVSNSRPIPWQGIALPTELLPQNLLLPASNFWVKNPRRFQTSVTWSGRRVSNPRPISWQGIALPTELLSQNLFLLAAS